jgi:GTP-binding protein HflX
MPRMDEFVFAPETEVERAYLIGLGRPHVSADELEERMRELSELVDTAGAEVLGSDVQHLRQPNPSTCYGKGKVEELRRLRSDLAFTTLVSNEELSPRQQRNLEDALDMKVLDRTEIILDIFARHARTHEGRLQVEVAQLRHLLPRLAGGRNLSRLGGGIGTRGPGEQKLEVDRRRIRQRVGELGREIKKLENSRRLHRASRQRTETPVVAVVGYTNAGKSTLMNALTGAGVVVMDQVFATLDPTTRGLELPDGHKILMTDTVGFIQQLPTELVAAFHATLEEVTEADLILHVLDISHPAAHDHFEATNAILDQLEALDKPLLLALNKRDLLDRPVVDRLLRRGDWSPYSEVLPVSALRGTGLESLKQAIGRMTSGGLVRIELMVPYDHAGVEADVRSRGRVLELSYDPGGIRIAAEVPRSVAARFEPYQLPDRAAVPTSPSG